MTPRMTTLFIGALDLLAWLWLCWGTFFSQADAANKVFTTVSGAAVSLLFFATVVPALILAGLDIKPRTALALSLAFPGGFMLLFLIAVIVFA